MRIHVCRCVELQCEAKWEFALVWSWIALIATAVACCDIPYAFAKHIMTLQTTSEDT